MSDFRLSLLPFRRTDLSYIHLIQVLSDDISLLSWLFNHPMTLSLTHVSQETQTHVQVSILLSTNLQAVRMVFTIPLSSLVEVM